MKTTAQRTRELLAFAHDTAVRLHGPQPSPGDQMVALAECLLVYIDEVAK
jgi:hypothetical protein